MYDLGYRLWLKKDGKCIVGDIEAELLRRIREGHSLAEVAQGTGMAIEETRAIVERIEAAMGTSIVDDIDTLNEEGEELLFRYEGQTRSARERLESVYRNPSLTADAVILIDGELLLVERGREPFKGSYALPGGFMNYGERAEECAVREVEEETGLETMVLDLIGIYSSPDRDPRGHTVTIAYLMKATGGKLRSGDDASDVKLFPLDDLPDLAFDHRMIVDDFLRNRR